MSHDQEGQMAIAYKLTTLDNLDGSQTSVSGNNPQGGLIMDAAGNLFGTTSAGGAFGDGTVFEIDRIDLGDILFNQPGTTLGFTENAANTGGALTVSDGSHVASMALLGQYMASCFARLSDGHGGALVTDPAIAAQATIATPHQV